VIESVKNWKTLETVKEVQKYLDLCSYYRQYVPKFSEKASPLSSLTRKNTPFKWTPECNDSFLFLKKALCEAPILAYPLPKGLFVLDTDASNVGIGGVLSQVQDNKEKVIAYGSKKLDKQQQRYSVTRRELLVVITFIHQFRHFLWGRNFLLRTDHGSLKWLFNFKDSQGQLARWLEVLSQYDFEIQHRLGSKHQNADPLSRKDGDHPLCEHQMKGENNVKCDICISMSVLVLNETG
jgi:phospholipid-translocating ATPase